MLDRAIAGLMSTVNPNTGKVDVNIVWATKEQVKSDWERYQALFQATEIAEDEEDAADTEYAERMSRYNAALGAARGLLEPTGSEVGSLREGSNSTSNQLGEEVVAAPTHCKMAVKNAEVTISRHIKGLKDAVEQEDPIVPAAWKERHAWIISSEFENLNQLYLRWTVADIAKEEEIRGLHTASVAKFMDELDAIWRDILRKTPPDPMPPPTPAPSTCSNTSQKQQFGFKKRDPPQFSGQVRDYPKFKRLWRAVQEQFSEAHQLDLIKENVPKSVDAKIKNCQTMESVWERLEDEFGRADEVGMTLVDGFSKLMLSQKSEHDNFIQLFDKFEETLHDLEEIDSAQLMKEKRSMRDVTEKMSKGIRDRYYEFSAKGASDDKWEVLLDFMKL